MAGNVVGHDEAAGHHARDEQVVAVDVDVLLGIVESERDAVEAGGGLGNDTCNGGEGVDLLNGAEHGCEFLSGIP